MTDTTERRRRREHPTERIDGPPQEPGTTISRQVDELPRRLLEGRHVDPGGRVGRHAIGTDPASLFDAERVQRLSRPELLRAVAETQADLAIPLLPSTADLSDDELRGVLRGLCQVTGRWRES